MYTVFFDGACDPNPGRCAFGVSVQKDGVEIDRLAQFIGTGTNNIAEYHGLIGAIQLCHSNNLKDATVFGDSLLVINQVNMVWKVNSDKLQVLHTIVLELLKKCGCNVKLQHIKRKFNERADQLATDILKTHHVDTT